MQPTMAIVYEPYRVLISLLHPPSQYPPSQYPPFMYPSAPQLAAPWYSTPIQVSQPATLHEQGTVYTSLLQPPAPYYTAVNSSEQQLYRVCNHQPFIMPTHQLAQPSTRQAQLPLFSRSPPNSSPSARDTEYGRLRYLCKRLQKSQAKTANPELSPPQPHPPQPQPLQPHPSQPHPPQPHPLQPHPLQPHPLQPHPLQSHSKPLSPSTNSEFNSEWVVTGERVSHMLDHDEPDPTLSLAEHVSGINIIGNGCHGQMEAVDPVPTTACAGMGSGHGSSLMPPPTSLLVPTVGLTVQSVLVETSENYLPKMHFMQDWAGSVRHMASCMYFRDDGKRYMQGHCCWLKEHAHVQAGNHFGRHFLSCKHRRHKNTIGRSGKNTCDSLKFGVLVTDRCVQANKMSTTSKHWRHCPQAFAKSTLTIAVHI